MEKFAALLGKERVAYLTAGREFLGKQWFKYLSFNWGFRIRIRHTDLIGDGRRYLPGNVIFSSLAVGEVRSLPKRRRIWGIWMYVSALTLESQELLIVVSDRPGESAKIETLFGYLKTHIPHFLTLN